MSKQLILRVVREHFRLRLHFRGLFGVLSIGCLLCYTPGNCDCDMIAGPIRAHLVGVLGNMVWD